MSLEEQIAQHNKAVRMGVTANVTQNQQSTIDSVEKAIIQEQVNLNEAEKLIKGRAVPVGTIAKRPNGMFIKTPTGWKYHSSHSVHEYNTRPSSPDAKNHIGTQSPSSGRGRSTASAGQRSDGKVNPAALPSDSSKKDTKQQKEDKHESGISRKEYDKLHPDTKKQLDRNTIPPSNSQGIIHPDKIFHNKVQQNTRNDLKSFFEKVFGKTMSKINLSHRKNVWNKSHGLSSGRDPKIESVDIKNIVPSQDYINKDVLEEYIKDRAKGDSDDSKIPLGIRITGSDKVVLFDGHHRVSSDIVSGKGSSDIKLVSSYGLFKHYKNKIE